MGRILAIGITPFIIVALDNVMIIAMNAVLQRYGGPTQGEVLITCATIVQSFMLMVTMPMGVFRAAQGCWPLTTAPAPSTGAGGPSDRFLSSAPVCCTDDGGRLGGGAVVRAALYPRRRHHEQAVWAIRVCTLAMSTGHPVRRGRRLYRHGAGTLCHYLSLWRKSVYFIFLFLLPMWFRRARGIFCRADFRT
jgi:hypothetical protein